MVYNKTDIARKTGLSRQTIIKVLNGKARNPKLVTLKKIANVLKCSIDDLLKDSG